MANKPSQDHNEPKTTGHEWDGIQEYNNPLPRWWLWVFIVSVIFSIGYVIYYPALPLLNGFTKGVAGWSQYKELEESQQYAAERRAGFEQRIAGLSAEDINNDPELKAYAVNAGRSLFALHCSQCHGQGAAGAKGYPNLLDNEWIWGGKLEDIVYTLHHGVRSYDDDMTRDNVMAAYGKDEILTAEQIEDVIRYIRVLGGNFTENEASDRGKVVFAEVCSACHGENGEGMNELGAPALNNHIWLYGGDKETLVETLTYGRAGVMPAWGAKLTDDQINKLAVYVYNLGGGQ